MVPVETPIETHSIKTETHAKSRRMQCVSTKNQPQKGNSKTMAENTVPPHKHRFLIRLALAALVLIICGCFCACTRTDQKPSGPPEKITIAYAVTLDGVLAEIALAKDYFKQEGLEVTSHMHPFGKPALEDVLAGKADFATVAEIPVMFAIMKGEKISVIATIQSSNLNNSILARRDKGIVTPEDLKGKKIAVSSGTTSEFFLDALLATHGMSRKDI